MNAVQIKRKADVSHADVELQAAATQDVKRGGLSNQAALEFLKSQADFRRADSGLESAMNARISERFGIDLSGVRLYRDAGLADSPVEERAYASGREIHVDDGVDLHSAAGERLLTHEAAHVIQQGRGLVSSSGFAADGAMERQADSVSAGSNMDTGGFSLPAQAGPVQGENGFTKFFKNLFHKSAKPAQDSAEPVAPVAPVKNAAGHAVPQKPLPSTPDWAALQQAGQSGDQNAISHAYEVLSDRQTAAATPAQHRAISEYIVDSRPVNGFLRGNQDTSTPMGAQQKQQADTISSAMKKTDADVTAYRGVSDVALVPLLMGSGHRSLRRAVRKDGTIDHKRLAKNIHKLEGLEFSDMGFGSTSLQESFAEKWRRGIVDRDLDTRATDEVWKRHQKTDQDSIQEILGCMNIPDMAHASAEQQVMLRGMIAGNHSGEYSGIKERLQNRGMGAHMYQINVPRGSSAALIDKMRIWEDGKQPSVEQGEMLLDRNARYRIQRVEQMMDENHMPMKDQYRFIMDLVQDKKRT